MIKVGTVEHMLMVLGKTPAEKPEVQWLGSSTCNICGKDPSDVGDTSYDAKLNYSGQWAYMCKPCFDTHGRMFGQEYNAVTLTKIRDLS